MTTPVRINSELLPDLHHKMSKKIAQLTKVIYHLNTRNEDNEFEKALKNEQHELEIDSIVKDAAQKINHFKDLLAKKTSEAVSQSTVKKLKEMHNKERKRAQQQLKDLEKQFGENEEKIRLDYQKNLDSLTALFNEQKANFQAKIKDFNAKIKQFKDQKKRDDEQLRREQEKNKSEINDLVKTNNTKYNNMLAEQLNEQDRLKESLQRKHEQEIQELKEKYEKQLQDQRSELLSSHSSEQADTQSIISKLKQNIADLTKSEANLKQKNDQLNQSITQLENSKQQLLIAMDNLKADKEKLQKELER
jgi:chromosome segregation ATPase